MAAFLIFASLLPAEASAETSTETLPNVAFHVNNNDVAVTLQLPQAKNEAITSLQFQLTVSIVNGTMEQPTFSFSDTLESTVKDAAVSKYENTADTYLVDIILSGKQDQDIFKNGTQAELGTLSLHPSNSSAIAFKATVTFGKKKNETYESVIKYVTANGQSVQTVSLSETTEATVGSEGNTAPDNSGTPSAPSGSVTPSTPSTPGSSTNTTTPVTPPSDTTVTTTPVLPAESETPAASVVPVTSDSITPATPVTPETPAASETPVIPAVPVISETPADSSDSETATTEQNFNQKKSPTLKTSVKNGSNRITFRWNTVKGADGYILYRYHKNSKTYQQIKKISGQSTDSCSKKLKYGSQYSFKIRAFHLDENGEMIYGKFSSIVKTVTAPAKVKKLSRSKGVISWKKVSNADGYQILYSAKKNGKYSAFKTVKKTNIKSGSVLKKNKKARYCKIRAYTNAGGGKRVYSKISKACRV